MIDKRLFRLLGENRRYIGYCVALQLASLAASLTVTACLCRAIYLAAQKNFPETGAFFILAAAAFAAMAVRYLAARKAGDLKDQLGRKAKQDLREKVYDKIVRLGVRSADGMSMAGMTQVALEGVEQLDLYYSSYLPQFFYAMLAPLVLFSVTVWIDWRVAAALLVCVPLIPLSIVAVSRYAKRIFAKYWGQYISMGDAFLDSVQGLRELKLFRADARQHQRMNAAGESFRKITMKVLVMQLASTTIMDLVAYGGAGAGIALALQGVVHRGLSPFAALFLMLVAVEFFLPLRAFGAAFHVAMNGVSSGNKILSLLEQPDPAWGQNIPDGGELRLEGVSFSYDGKREVLHDAEMSFLTAGMTAIVGPSGCGKSTVVGLLTGALRPDTGQVTLDGTPLEQLARDAYYARIAVVSYNTYLFNATVRQNFLLARPDATESQIYQALDRMNLGDFVRTHGGLDKIITEEASNLSGGQRQRLALAVNLVADKDIYIFDEATSNIDAESEAVIMQEIRALARHKAVIVISHRLANVVLADRIYYLEAGRVAEQGTHSELMHMGGRYAGIYTAQKQLEEGYREVIG